MLPTRDHDAILKWARENDAVPAEVFPLKFDGEPTRLHFLFGEAKVGTADLHPTTWDAFFAIFDLLELSIAFDQSSSRFQIVRVRKPMDQASVTAIN